MEAASAIERSPRMRQLGMRFYEVVWSRDGAEIYLAILHMPSVAEAARAGGVTIERMEHLGILDGATFIVRTPPEGCASLTHCHRNHVTKIIGAKFQMRSHGRTLTPLHSDQPINSDTSESFHFERSVPFLRGVLDTH